jgi:hypothetical protein
MPTPLDVLEQGRAQRLAADGQLISTLFNHLKSGDSTTVQVPEHSSLGCWLQLYRRALSRPHLRAWATRLPVDLAGLDVQPNAAPLELPAQPVLNFYGYPYPEHRGQCRVITQALDQSNSFVDPKADLDDRLKRLNQDQQQIADQLQTLLDDDDFSLFSSYKTYFKLDSGSFWATAQQTGAALLDAITRSPPFLALDAVDGLQPGAYAFDPATRRLSGKKAWGTLVEIGIEELLALPLNGQLEQLVDIAEQLGSFVHQSGQFSLAELLRCHDLPVPDTPDEARTLIDTLRQSTPLSPLPVSDLADSDLALMQHQQWLARDHDRDVMAECLRTLLQDQPSDRTIDTASVTLTPAPDSAALHHPAVTPSPVCGPFTLKQLLQTHDFDPPGTVGAAQDTLQALEMNLPRRPEFDDYHGLLSATAQSPVRLLNEQRHTLLATANNGLPVGHPSLLDRLCDTLLSGLHADAIRNQADHLLKQVLRLGPARQLGQRLVTALRWYGQHPDETASQTSLDLLVLSAVILDLDPAAGEEGAPVAGFDLSAHAGQPHGEVRQALELHLVRTCKVSTRAAPLAAHVLLAGAAPEFLVQGLPETLRFRTSIAWMSFRQGVLMAQAMAPGSPRHLTYNDMIALASLPTTTGQQQQWREYIATRTLLDWAIAVGELPERENTPYLAHEIDALKLRLTQRLHALKRALITFADTPPTRRSIALADLKQLFPSQTLLEQACLWRPVPPLASGSLRFPMHHHERQNYSLHSLVELHMDGQLGDRRWHSTEPQLNLAQLRPSFGRLGNIQQRFDTAFSAYIERMKQAYSTTIEDLLAQLPLADRIYLQQADLQLLVLKQEPGKDLALLSPEEELARSARMGVILRGTSATAVHEYELFPLLNRVHKRSGAPLAFREGGTLMSVITGAPHSTRPVTQLLMGDELPLDWDAYASGRPPRPGLRSKVIVQTLCSFSPRPVNPPSAALTYGSALNRAIAQAIVQQHFFLEVDALHAQARGTTQREQIQQRWDRLWARLKALVPFWSCAEDIGSGNTRRVIEGAYACFIDLLTLLFPTQRFLKASLAVLKKTVPLPIKLLQLGQLSSSFLNTVLNPLDGLPGLFRLARSGMLRLSSGARNILDTAIAQVQHHAADLLLLDYPRLLAGADIGSGTVLRDSDLLRINAMLRKNHWYPCHPFTRKPYGPPSHTFRLDSALGVAPMQSAHGRQVLVSERLFATPPLLIPRSDATDLLDHANLLRLEHRAPTHLDDLTSAAYFKVAEGFDSLCGPARNKRSPIPLICFTKKLAAFNTSIQQRRAQAIEHIRLIPAPAVGADTRKLVHNRRLYAATPQGTTFELTPVASTTPLSYKPQVTGRLIDSEPQFGLPNNQLDNQLSRDTRVVELAGLTEGTDDSRTLRAMAIDLSPGGGTRIIVEADAGVFYEAIPSAPAPALLFNRLDFGQGAEPEQLIRAFSKCKLDYLNAAGFVHNRPLVTLPTLEVLSQQLAARGFGAAKLQRLIEQSRGLRVIKQRELLLNASDQGQRLGMSVAVAPLKLESWPPYAAQPGQTINQYLATKAHASTVALVKSTGIGPANVVGTGIAELERLSIAEPLVMWQYSRAGQPNYTEVILKTGAGNCDQMAHVACELITFNGGAARIWGTSPPAHAFVVVGIAPATLGSTVDFGEAGWRGLWICDPWAAIVCPASDYMRQLNVKMHAWYLEDISVFFNDRGTYRWGQANDRNWLALLRSGVKRPQP